MPDLERRQGLSQRLRTNLTISEDLHGRLDLRSYPAAQELSKALAPNRAFIGVAQFGSRTQGHAELLSDVDLVIFYDSTKLPGPKGFPNISEFEDEVKKKAQELNEELVIWGAGIKCNLQDLGYGGWQQTVGMLANGEPFEEEHEQYHDSLAYLFGQTIIGPRIDKYRELIKKRILKYPKEKQDLVIEGLANFAVKGEGPSMYGKAVERVPEIQKSELPAIESDRKELWKEQIRQALRLDR